MPANDFGLRGEGTGLGEKRKQMEGLLKPGTWAELPWVLRPKGDPESGKVFVPAPALWWTPSPSVPPPPPPGTPLPPPSWKFPNSCHLPIMSAEFLFSRPSATNPSLQGPWATGWV